MASYTELDDVKSISKSSPLENCNVPPEVIREYNALKASIMEIKQRMKNEGGILQQPAIDANPELKQKIIRFREVSNLIRVANGSKPLSPKGSAIAETCVASHASSTLQTTVNEQMDKENEKSAAVDLDSSTLKSEEKVVTEFPPPLKSILAKTRSTEAAIRQKEAVNCTEIASEMATATTEHNAVESSTPSPVVEECHELGSVAPVTTSVVDSTSIGSTADKFKLVIPPPLPVSVPIEKQSPENESEDIKAKGTGEEVDVESHSGDVHMRSVQAADAGCGKKKDAQIDSGMHCIGTENTGSCQKKPPRAKVASLEPVSIGEEVVTERQSGLKRSAQSMQSTDSSENSSALLEVQNAALENVIEAEFGILHGFAKAHLPVSTESQTKAICATDKNETDLDDSWSYSMSPAHMDLSTLKTSTTLTTDVSTDSSMTANAAIIAADSSGAQTVVIPDCVSTEAVTSNSTSVLNAAAFDGGVSVDVDMGVSMSPVPDSSTTTGIREAKTSAASIAMCSPMEVEMSGVLGIENESTHCSSKVEMSLPQTVTGAASRGGHATVATALPTVGGSMLSSKRGKPRRGRKADVMSAATVAMAPIIPTAPQIPHSIRSSVGGGDKAAATGLQPPASAVESDGRAKTSKRRRVNTTTTKLQNTGESLVSRRKRRRGMTSAVPMRNDLPKSKTSEMSKEKSDDNELQTPTNSSTGVPLRRSTRKRTTPPSAKNSKKKKVSQSLKRKLVKELLERKPLHCGVEMIRERANSIYADCSGIVCDGCDVELSGRNYVWTCARGKCAAHCDGLDYCDECAAKLRPLRRAATQP